MVDWEGLKALEAKSSASFFPQDHINLHGAILAAFPAILAEHESQLRVIAAAEKLFCESIVATQFMDKHRNHRMTCDVQELLTYFNGHKPA